jgi:hypothetical protein
MQGRGQCDALGAQPLDAAAGGPTRGALVHRMTRSVLVTAAGLRVLERLRTSIDQTAGAIEDSSKSSTRSQNSGQALQLAGADFARAGHGMVESHRTIFRDASWPLSLSAPVHSAAYFRARFQPRRSASHRPAHPAGELQTPCPRRPDSRPLPSARWPPRLTATTTRPLGCTRPKMLNDWSPSLATCPFVILTGAR